MTPERRLRVLQVITHFDVGGATEAAANACGYIDRDRFESAIVGGPVPRGDGDFLPRAERLGLRVIILPELQRAIRPGRDVRALHRLRRLLRAERPDVVHTHSSKAGIIGRLAAHRERVPAVVHTVHGWSFHGYMPGWQRAAYIRLERRAARWTDRLVTVCEADRAKGLAAGIGSPDQYRTIPALTDLEPYARPPSPASIRKRLGLPPDTPVIGTVGRLSDQKDPLTFLRAAASIAAQTPGARFVMVGDGPMRAAVERHGRALGLTDRLLLTGVRDDVPALLPAFDVFLLTSRWEGLPLVVPQAMAAGVPVVATAVDGVPEVIDDGENGLLAPPEAPEALARAVVTVLRSPDRRGRMAAAARTTALRFALAGTVPQMEALYLDCAAGPRRAVPG